MRVRSSLPNLLSLSRIPMGGILILLYSDDSKFQYSISVAILLLSLITDVLDGYLARRLGTDSKSGYLLDGLGDRSIYLAAILTFYRSFDIAGLVAWILILREVAVYAVRVIYVDWHENLVISRRHSLLHALAIRLWIGLVVLSDGLDIFAPSLVLSPAVVLLEITMERVTLACTMAFGYTTLYFTIRMPFRELG